MLREQRKIYTALRGNSAERIGLAEGSLARRRLHRWIRGPSPASLPFGAKPTSRMSLLWVRRVPSRGSNAVLRSHASVVATVSPRSRVFPAAGTPPLQKIHRPLFGFPLPENCSGIFWLFSLPRKRLRAAGAKAGTILCRGRLEMALKRPAHNIRAVEATDRRDFF